MLKAATPQVQKGYIVIDTLCLLSLDSLSPCAILFAFIRFHFLNLHFCTSPLYCALWRYLPITKYSGICSNLCFILGWPSWSACARRKEQELLPVVINALCNCPWHWDAILWWACERRIKSAMCCETSPMTIIWIWKKRSLVLTCQYPVTAILQLLGWKLLWIISRW